MSSIPQLLDTIFQEAATARASDVHIEPSRDEHESVSVHVRFRIDGLLQPWGDPFDGAVGLALVSRLKVLAQLNSAEKRQPQDGSFPLLLHDRSYDIRIATFPCVYGEKVVLRLLDRSGRSTLLTDLGLSPLLHHQLINIAHASQGFFLVTGPTGSGKTTTLHAMLAQSASPDKNVVTLEDPVEYLIPGITQTTIVPAIGFTFEKALRSLLRQDPDVIMLGEIRDRETAQIAIQAALTGHLLFSTFHTADAPQAVVRLLDMGIEPFLLTAAIKGILSQRLARRLCQDCRHEAPVLNEERLAALRLGLTLERSYKGSGCASCRTTGYSGRVGIFQLMLMSTDLSALTMERPSYNQLYDLALSEGMAPLAHDALTKVHDGVISFSELVRVLS